MMSVSIIGAELSECATRGLGSYKIKKFEIFSHSVQLLALSDLSIDKSIRWSLLYIQMI
jgi:hypothetical protein